jgi:hypothetical protein
MIVNSGKGQFKIQQMIFMVLGLTVFFGLVAMFFLMFQVSDIKQSASLSAQENAKLLVLRVANVPELRCGGVFGNSMIDCIDTDKAMVLMENSQKYKDYFGATASTRIVNINLEFIYPEKEARVCSTSNYPNCNMINIFNDEITGTCEVNFVTLCRKQEFGGKVRDICEMGRVYVCYEKVN